MLSSLKNKLINFSTITLTEKQKILISFFCALVIGFLSAKISTKPTYITKVEFIEQPCKQDQVIDKKDEQTEDEKKENVKPTFWSKNEKTLSLTSAEKKQIKIFKDAYMHCRSSLSSQEKKTIDKIKLNALSSIERNQVKIDYTDFKGSEIAIKKIKVCQKIAYKKIPKQNKLDFKSAVKKMNIKDVVNLYDAVR